MRRGERAHGVRLFFAREHPDRPVDDFPPRPPTRRGCAVVVDRDDDVALVGNQVVPQRGAAAPGVVRSLARRLAVHVHQQRIAPCRIETRGFDHPAVERDTIAHRHLEELTGMRDVRRHGGAQLRVVDERADDAVRRQLDQLRHRRAVEMGIGVKREVRVGRDSVGVRPHRRSR